MSSSSTLGKHKIFMGYAPGVGKTYAMLDEAKRRRSRGQDVVIGLVESHGNSPTGELAHDFEIIPALFTGDTPAINVDAVIARRPDAVLVDDLHERNAPGSARASRWEDVHALLEAGINVLSTVNVQHIESLNDHIEEITGIREEATVPDQVFRDAEEVEIVDVTPRALINRLERGDIHVKGMAPDAYRKFFKEGTLAALREMALREAARHVDSDVLEFRSEEKIQKPWATSDKILICISPTRSSLRLIRRGWRIGQKLHGEIEALYVEEGKTGEKEKKILQDDFALAQRLGIKLQTLQGEPAEQIIKYAQQNNITQIIIGHSERPKMQELWKGSILGELAKALKTVDILVVATEIPARASH